jgi:hypothetical protein
MLKNYTVRLSILSFTLAFMVSIVIEAQTKNVTHEYKVIPDPNNQPTAIPFELPGPYKPSYAPRQGETWLLTGYDYACNSSTPRMIDFVDLDGNGVMNPIMTAMERITPTGQRKQMFAYSAFGTVDAFSAFDLTAGTSGHNTYGWGTLQYLKGGAWDGDALVMSHSNGTTWFSRIDLNNFEPYTPFPTITFGGNYPSFVYLPSGKIIANSTNYIANTLYNIYVSTNYGATFDSIGRIGLGDPNVSLGVDPSEVYLHMSDDGRYISQAGAWSQGAVTGNPDIIYVYSSSNFGSTWAGEIAGRGSGIYPEYGQVINRNYAPYFTNFGQLNSIVDNMGVTHLAVNGYGEGVLPGATDTTNVAPMLYWNSRHKNWIAVSLPSTEKWTDGFGNSVTGDPNGSPPTGRIFSGNGIGQAYGTVTVSDDGQVVVVAWQGFEYTGAIGESAWRIFPGDGGANSGKIYYHDLYYAISTDGGTIWADAQILKGDANVHEIYPYLARRLAVDPVTNNYVAYYVYYQDAVPGVAIFTGALTGQNSWDASGAWKWDKKDLGIQAVLKPLTVISPNGGESWAVGSNQTITWASSYVTNVKIEYTTDGGYNWITIISSTPSDGTYEWTTPNTPSTLCKVKISDLSNPGIYDVSNSAFSISEFVFYAQIQANPIWIDVGYDGLELGVVDGSGSYTNHGTIINYEWFVNNEFVANSMSPTIELTTGTSIVKLIVHSSTGSNASDSMYISVYAAKLAIGGSILGGISQNGNRFYVTSMNNGVHRINSTGTIIQSYITGGSIQSSLCISSQTNLMYVGSADTRLYCFDPGLNSLWDRGLGGVVNNSASVNYDGSIVYVGANNDVTNLGFLKSFAASNGNPKWTFQADGKILSSPVVMELVDSTSQVIRTIIYFGTSKGTVYAINDFGASYELFWSQTINPDSAFVSSPAISKDGMLYIGSRNGYLYRFNWNGDYQTSWRKYTGGAIISSPIIDEDGIVYIASGSGYVYGFNKNFLFNSDPVKTFYQNVEINATAGIGPYGTLLVGTSNGKFFALDKNASGVNMPIKWYFQATAPILAPTLVTDNGTVYIGTTDGDIFIMKDPYAGGKQLSLSDYDWPTFKGDNQRSKVVRLLTDPTTLGDENKIATDYNLYQNFPNPFNPATRIKFEIPNITLVSLKIFDVLGNEVGILVNREMEAGSYEVEFDAVNLPSGIYFYKLQTNTFVQTKKMVLIK